jgi:hypothetical protein
MKKLLILIVLIFCFPSSVGAVYEITDFTSQIDILQNTTIRVEENIGVNFLTEHHGIFRDIPEKIKVISVSDKYEVNRSGKNTQIKIGNPDKTIIGTQSYKIVYEVKNQITRFEDNDELYWNVTGSNWEVPIPRSRVTVSSDFAPINRVECFTGQVGGTNRDCVVTENTVESFVPVGLGGDFTIVVGLDKPNQLLFPSFLQQYWWYTLIFLPAILAAVMWWRKGRDDRFLGDNVYVNTPEAKTKNVSPFDRPHLPNVYYPIQDLTPAEAGTIIDQKVDLADVVAEITELARLKYLEIKPLKNDYAFLRTTKQIDQLKAHQILILNALTQPEYQTSQGYLLSKMKNKIYLELNKFKESLYTSLAAQKIFSGRPDRVKGGWITGILVFQFFLTQLMAVNNTTVYALGIVSGMIGWVFAAHMPKRTAWGYSLYRQLIGLKYFVGKGKWRYEIAEKKLFLEEILPIAISLGVVKQLTRDMQALELQEPHYLGGISSHNFSSFQNSMGSTLDSAPAKSGGSGFGGGGSSGGGGGGGGGGSW